MPFHWIQKLYYAFIHPHLLYGIEVYAKTCKSTLDKLYKLNNKLLRIVLKKRIDTPVSDLYMSMNTLNIPKLHYLQLLLFTHKCLYHKFLLPEVFHEFLQDQTLFIKIKLEIV